MGKKGSSTQQQHFSSFFCDDGAPCLGSREEIHFPDDVLFVATDSGVVEVLCRGLRLELLCAEEEGKEFLPSVA